MIPFKNLLCKQGHTVPGIIFSVVLVFSRSSFTIIWEIKMYVIPYYCTYCSVRVLMLLQSKRTCHCYPLNTNNQNRSYFKYI